LVLWRDAKRIAAPLPTGAGKQLEIAKSKCTFADSFKRIAKYSETIGVRKPTIGESLGTYAES
jgi:hypothetical protein